MASEFWQFGNSLNLFSYKFISRGQFLFSKVLYENSLSIGTARRFKTRGRRWNIEGEFFLSSNTGKTVVS